MGGGKEKKTAPYLIEGNAPRAKKSLTYHEGVQGGYGGRRERRETCGKTERKAEPKALVGQKENSASEL